MDTQNKTVMEIIQELIAIHITRKDAAEVLSGKAEEKEQASMLEAKQQSDAFITQLLSELSNFGDAVQDTADRDNEYQLKWRSAGSTIDSLKANEATDIFYELEKALKHVYDQVLTNKELPLNVSEMLSSQKNKIN